jgi:hypothetical protein
LASKILEIYPREALSWNVTQVKILTIINAIKSHSNEIIATKPIKKKPKIAIYGVSEEFSDHDIIDELIEKNEAIKTYLACVNSEDIDQEIKIKFKFRRNNKTSTANT